VLQLGLELGYYGSGGLAALCSHVLGFSPAKDVNVRCGARNAGCESAVWRLGANTLPCLYCMEQAARCSCTAPAVRAVQVVRSNWEKPNLSYAQIDTLPWMP